jgi:hypothetical protein
MDILVKIVQVFAIAKFQKIKVYRHLLQNAIIFLVNANVQKVGQVQIAELHALLIVGEVDVSKHVNAKIMEPVIG